MHRPGKEHPPGVRRARRHATAPAAILLALLAAPPAAAGSRSYTGVAPVGWRAFALRPSGHIDVVGSNPAFMASLVFARIDRATGDIVWQTEYDSHATRWEEAPYVQTLAPRRNGGWIAAGLTWESFETRGLLLTTDGSGELSGGAYWPLDVTDEISFNAATETRAGTIVVLAVMPRVWEFPPAWVIEFDDHGGALWGAAIGDPSVPIPTAWYLQDVQESADGGLVITGSDERRLPLLVGFAPDRTLAWSRRFDLGIDDLTLDRLEVMPSGRIHASGHTSTPPSPRWILTLDGTGALITARRVDTATGTGVSLGRLFETADGGLLVPGSADGEAILARWDAAGDPVWVRAYETGARSGLGHVWIEAGGGLFAAGWRDDTAWTIDLDDHGRPVGAPCISSRERTLVVEDAPVTVSDAEAYLAPLLPSPSAGAGLVPGVSRLFGFDTCDCPVFPAEIGLVRAWRSGVDVALTWAADVDATGYHVWTVTTKPEIDLARLSSSPPAVGVAGCSPPAPVPANACTDVGGVSRGELLFYQVRGGCATTVEGP